MCQEMFFIILATAITACQRLKYVSCRGSWSERSCPKFHSASVKWTHNLPIVRRTLSHWAIAVPAQSSSSMPMGVRWCYDATVGRYWETNDTRKRIKLALAICRDFMQNFFYQILRGWSIKTAALMFASAQSSVIAFLCSKDFSTRWWKWLCLARKL